jgi:hypothetical protein
MEPFIENDKGEIAEVLNGLDPLVFLGSRRLNYGWHDASLNAVSVI